MPNRTEVWLLENDERDFRSTVCHDTQEQAEGFAEKQFNDPTLKAVRYVKAEVQDE